jgi:hypothetical protein
MVPLQSIGAFYGEQSPVPARKNSTLNFRRTQGSVGQARIVGLPLAARGNIPNQLVTAVGATEPRVIEFRCCWNTSRSRISSMATYYVTTAIVDRSVVEPVRCGKDIGRPTSPM